MPRPLLTPGEVMQLPPADALILTGGAPPIRARKVRYFAEPLFKARLRPAARFAPTSGPGIPTCWDGLVAPAPSEAPPNPTKPAATTRTRSTPPLASRPQTSQATASHQRGFAFGASHDAAEPTTARSTAPSPETAPDMPSIEQSDPIRLQFGIDGDLGSSAPPRNSGS